MEMVYGIFKPNLANKVLIYWSFQIKYLMDLKTVLVNKFLSSAFLVKINKENSLYVKIRTTHQTRFLMISA